MSHFLETRGMLAKLLATENLIVEHDSRSNTASFNTATRVLKLPVLKTENENVYNMFVAHECAHALETPTQWKEDVPSDVPFDFVNVVEDVRIEKFIQSKFPGLRSDFSKGYDYLNQQDFFQILDKDLSQFSLIDRINLHFKLGSRALVPFSQAELTYVKAVDEADTWQKVILVSKLISEYVNQPDADNPEDAPLPQDAETSGTGDQQSSQASDTNQQQSGDDVDDEGGEENDGATEATDVGGKEASIDENKSMTQRALDEALEDMAENNANGYNNLIYTKIGDTDLKNVVFSIEQLRESILTPEPNMVQDEVKAELNKFLNQTKGDVNHMVQQFEMKKSADAYARAAQHKTGILNTNMLHNYKISDDLFLRQTITPDGKCHGMVMFLDWSGSMADICFSTVKQIIVLTQFCRKVQIPFDVYLFTTGNRDQMADNLNYGDITDEILNKYDRQIAHNVVGLTHVLTSSAKKSQIETDMFNLWCGAYIIHSGSRFSHALPCSSQFCMGGTPLNNALLLVPQIIKEFRAKTGAQKVSFVCITDGESAPVSYYAVRKKYDGTEYIGLCQPYWEKLMIKSNANVYPIGGENENGFIDRGTGDCVRWVQSQVDDVYISNIFLGTLSKSANHLSMSGGKLDVKKFKKDGCFATQTSSWPLVGVINPTSFGDGQSEIKVDDGATKAQIKSALGKMLKSKQSSRVILTQLANQFS